MPNQHQHHGSRNGRYEPGERSSRSAGGRSEGLSRQRDAEQLRAGYSPRDWERQDWSRNTRSEPEWDPERGVARDTNRRWEEERQDYVSPRYDRNEIEPRRRGSAGPDYYGERGFQQPEHWRSERRDERSAPDWGEPERHREPEGFGQRLSDAGRRLIGKVERIVRNPKNYRRSDERIREDVCDRLSVSAEVDPGDVEVNVANGEVTLTGTVQTRSMKFAAEEIADDVPGVHDVHNQLRVNRQ
jgi:hypothetical protein